MPIRIRTPAGTRHTYCAKPKHNKRFVESVQSHCIHTQFHWSSGPPVCFPSWGTRAQSPGGYLCETGILLLALSRYIGDPDRINHCGLVWGRLRPKPSLGCPADNVIMALDLTQLFCPGFTLAAGPPSGIHTQFHWSSGLSVCFLSWGTGFQCPGGTYVKPGFCS